jgi:hypothetical protein
VTGQEINWYPNVSLADRAGDSQSQADAAVLLRYAVGLPPKRMSASDHTYTLERMESTRPAHQQNRNRQ